VPRLEQRHTDLAHGLSTVLDREADGYKGGRCGRERPAEVWRGMTRQRLKSGRRWSSSAKAHGRFDNWDELGQNRTQKEFSRRVYAFSSCSFGN
jgi:hypothetical protein